MALALSILWVLAAFLALWGVSLMWRGWWPRGRVEGRLTCPACRKAVASGLVCGACGFEGQSARDFRTPRNWRLVLCGWIPVIAAGVAGVSAEVVRSWFTDEALDLGTGPVRAMAIGVALFAVVLGVWSWRGDRSHGRRRCPMCWYDMSGSKLVCPECGHDAKVVKRLYRARRRRGGIVVAGVLLVAAYGVWLVPRIQAGGPVAAVPTWVLIAGLPWWPEWMIWDDSASNYEEDWTLCGRRDDERLWMLETWLLRKRARGVAGGRASIRSLERVAPFLEEEADKDLGPAVSRTLLRGLLSASQEERDSVSTAAMSVYFLMGDPPKEMIRPHTQELTRLLHDPTVAVRGLAAGFLAELGAESSDTVPELIECLKTSGRRESSCFIISLRMIAKESEWARQVVMAALDDPDPDIRRGCAFALGSIEPLDGALIARLVALLDDPEEQVVSTAARALCRARAEPELVLPKIFERMERDGPDTLNLPSSVDRYGVHLQPYVHRLGRYLLSPDTRSEVLYLLEWMQRTADRPDFGPLLPYLHAVAMGDDIDAHRAVDVMEHWVAIRRE